MDVMSLALTAAAVVAAVGMFILWWRAERRADRAEAAHRSALRLAYRYWHLLNRHRTTEAEHFATLPAGCTPTVQIPTVRDR